MPLKATQAFTVKGNTMKKEFSVTLLAALLLAGTSAGYAGAPDPERIQEARQQTRAFAEDLKSTLMKGMKAEGPKAAIRLCNEEAPVIAMSHSTDGWDIGRTSLKIRNPENAPDAWEKQVLLDFASRHQAGESMDTMEASIQDGDTFRYMKAIPVGGPCVICHGETLAEPVQEELARLYPDDKATGFRQGDLRGAFTLTYTSD